MVALIRKKLGTALDFEVPSGGLALWAKVDPRIDVERWEAASRRRGAALFRASEAGASLGTTLPRCVVPASDRNGLAATGRKRSGRACDAAVRIAREFPPATFLSIAP